MKFIITNDQNLNEVKEELVIVIDVLRAFTTACFAINNNPKDYIVKQNYEFGKTIKFFWTGLSGNLPHLISIVPVLKKLSKQYAITIILVCSETIIIEGVEVKHYKWQKESFFPSPFP